MTSRFGGVPHGISPISTESDQIPLIVHELRAPTVYDTDYNLGDVWIYDYPTGETVYMLTYLGGDSTSKGELATWSVLAAGTGSVIKLADDAAVPAYPLAGTINIVGDGVNIFTSAAVDNTITIRYAGQPGELFLTNTGQSIPDPGTGIIRFPDGSNIKTSTGMTGPLFDIVYIDLADDVSISGSMTAGTGLTITAGDVTFGAFAGDEGILRTDAAGKISTTYGSADGDILVTAADGSVSWLPVLAGGSITVTPDPVTGQLTIGGGGGAGGVASFLTDDSSTVVPDGTGLVNVVGQNCIVTDGATANTIKVGVTEVAIPVGEAPVIVGMGIGTPSQWGSITADNGNTLVYAGGQIIIRGGGVVAGSGLQTMDVDDGTVSLTLVAPINQIQMYGATNQIITHAQGTTEIELQISPTLSLPGTLTIPAMSTAGVLMNSAAGVISSSAGTNGQVIIGKTGLAPVWSTLTAGTGISIDGSSVPGTITITNTSSGTGASLFVTNTGTATAVGPQIRIYGGVNITTSGGTDTVSVALKKNVILPPTTGSTLYEGMVGIGASTSSYGFPGDRFLHSYSGSLPFVYRNNCFVGHQSGNMSATTASNITAVGEGVADHITSATDCTIMGTSAGDAITSGSRHSLYGSGAGGALTTSGDNCAFGYNSSNALTGSQNCSFGSESLLVATTSNYTSCFGSNSGKAISTGDSNNLYGYNSGVKINTGFNNSAYGFSVLENLTSGSSNCAYGNGSLGNIVTGVSNACYGGNSGYSLTLADSYNIMIGNVGVAGDGGVIRIGFPGIATGTHGSCYIAGILPKSGGLSAKRLITVQRTSISPVQDKLDDIAEPMGGGKGRILFGGDDSTVPSGDPAWGDLTSTDGSLVLTRSNYSIDLAQRTVYPFTAYNTILPGPVTGSGEVYVFGKSPGSAWTEEYDPQGVFYPGDGGSNGIRFTAPINGFYSLTVGLQYYITVPAAPVPPPPPPATKDPIFIKIYNSSNSLKRTFMLDYWIETPVQIVGSSQSITYNAIFTVDALMNATDYALYSFSVTLDPVHTWVSFSGGAGNTFVTGYLIEKV